MAKEDTRRFGFRLLAVDTWLHVDPVWSGTVMSSSRPDPSDAWVHDVCQIRLTDRVPDSIQRLFEVARGSYAYGLMFYPLLTLGAEQLLRVVEGAVAFRFKERGGPGKFRTFQNRIDWMTAQGIISTDQQRRLHQLRVLRNSGSHPSDQNIYNPMMAFEVLEMTAELLNELFEVVNA
jgi:hypothetical protein